MALTAWSIAMKAPVRPIPAEQCTSIGFARWYLIITKGWRSRGHESGRRGGSVSTRSGWSGQREFVDTQVCLASMTHISTIAYITGEREATEASVRVCVGGHTSTASIYSGRAGSITHFLRYSPPVSCLIPLPLSPSVPLSCHPSPPLHPFSPCLPLSLPSQRAGGTDHALPALAPDILNEAEDALRIHLAVLVGRDVVVGPAVEPEVREFPGVVPVRDLEHVLDEP